MCHVIARVRAPAPAQFAIGSEGADEPISQALAWYDRAVMRSIDESRSGE
jgi:hypothetical protein